ncbi:MAG: hypothetical protein AAB605_01870 [Patescibacteria group bacterium]
MQPFPAYRRRISLVVFMALFAILLPLVIMYADGWRFKSGYGFVKTGGVYVGVPYSDATLYFDGREYGKSGFLQRSFYIDDLAPSAYVVRVDRPGYRSWGRILVVEPQIVTDARVLLIPESFTFRPVTVGGSATTTRAVSRAVYNSYTAAFATSTVASTTVPVDESDDIALFIDAQGDMIARYEGNSIPPSTFCSSPLYCAREIRIPRQGGPVLDARFFQGGVVYRTKEGGIYFAEVDIRSTPVGAQLFSAKDADMRVIDGTLILQSGQTLFEVSL